MKENWTYKKLGEVCTIERGGSPRPISDYITDAPDGLNWIKIGDATEGSKYITSTKEKIKLEGLKKTRFVHKGDFILSNSMSFGRPYILEIDGCIHDGWLVIHDDNDTFDKSYLYYLLGSPNMYKEFQRLAVGGVVNNLNSEIVRNVVVAIPPLETQSRIVSELDLLQSIMDKQQAQLKELDTLAQAVFYDMFGDPVENEKGWEVKKLGECCNSVSYGTSLPSSNQGDYIYLRMNNITYSGELDLTDIKYINLEQSDFEKYSVKEGDVLFNRTNSADLVGKTTWFHNHKPMIIAGYIIRVRLNDLLLPVYVSMFMNTKEMKKILKAMGKGAVNQSNINSKELQSISIPIPPLSLQPRPSLPWWW